MNKDPEAYKNTALFAMLLTLVLTVIVIAGTQNLFIALSVPAAFILGWIALANAAHSETGTWPLRKMNEMTNERNKRK